MQQNKTLILFFIRNRKRPNTERDYNTNTSKNKKSKLKSEIKLSYKIYKDLKTAAMSPAVTNILQASSH